MSNATIAPLTRTVAGTELPAPGSYAIDATHSTIGFTARHLMVTKVRGEFGEVSGTVVIADNPVDSSVQAAIPTASFRSGNVDRDGHVRSADFLDVEQFPTIAFASTGLTAKGRDWLLTGDLTIRDTTRPITLAVAFDGAGVDPWGGGRLGFSAKGEIDREDFGITWNQTLETGGVLVSKKIAIELEVQAVHQA